MMYDIDSWWYVMYDWLLSRNVCGLSRVGLYTLYHAMIYDIDTGVAVLLD